MMMIHLKILKSADNYGYKEIKNIKNYNPNTKMEVVFMGIGKMANAQGKVC